MKRQTPVHEQVFQVLYPNGQERPEDPKDWSAFVRKELLREVRYECRSFYGEDLGTTVLQPGLDYAYPPHRRRLGRFHHHIRLFAAMDRLGLTSWEIYNLCCWENTVYARDRAQERRPGEKIDDDTGDDIPTWEEVQAERRRALADEDALRRQALDQLSCVDADEAVHDSDGTVEGDDCASAGEDVEMSEYETHDNFLLPARLSLEVERRGNTQVAAAAANTARLSSGFRPPLQQSAIAPA